MVEHAPNPWMLNGAIDVYLPVADRGLHYGDGLFETIRLQEGRLPLLADHLSRLSSSCEVLRIPCDTETIGNWLAEYVDHLKSRQLLNGAVKIIVTRGIGGRGYLPPTAKESIANVLFLISDFHHVPLPPQTLLPLQCRLVKNPLLAGLKHLNRLEYVLAASELVHDTNFTNENIQGLLLDTEGNVIESLHYNIYMVRGKQLRTPRLNHCGVAGVMRKILNQRVATRLGLAIQELDMGLDHLRSADEVFICNSVRGVVPVDRFQDRIWSRWPITRLLAKNVEDIWNEIDS